VLEPALVPVLPVVAPPAVKALGGRGSSSSPGPVIESESDTEEILHEGCVGVPHVDVVTADASTLRASVLSGLCRPGGPGVLTMSGLMDKDAVRAARAAVLRALPRAAVPIFNTQSVVEMRLAEEQGAAVDKNRMQALMNPRWGATALVQANLSRVCDLLYHVYGVRYEASEPKVLLTLPGAPRQMPHGDAADKNKLGNPPRMIGVVMAVEDGSMLDTWPGCFSDDVPPGERVAVVRTALAERALVPVGGVILFRGDMVHRGVENASQSCILRRIHAYLTICGAPMSSEAWRDETCPVKEIP